MYKRSLVSRWDLQVSVSIMKDSESHYPYMFLYVFVLYIIYNICVIIFFLSMIYCKNTHLHSSSIHLHTSHVTSASVTLKRYSHVKIQHFLRFIFSSSSIDYVKSSDNHISSLLPILLLIKTISTIQMAHLIHGHWPPFNMSSHLIFFTKSTLINEWIK